MKVLGALKRHKWRYIAIGAGFALLVYPAALLIRGAYMLQGSAADPTLHKVCFRMPFDWIVTGKVASIADRPILLFFLIGVFGVAFFFGPLFCGWLCPVGSSTELLSRPMPRKLKIDLSQKVSPTAIRYGFLAAFGVVSALAVFAPSTGFAGVCCRYCAASVLQNGIDGIFNPTALEYVHSGGLIVLGGWLFLGGFFWQGGRGWCLYGCPLGAVSNLFHTVGSKLRFTFRIKHDPTNCIECHKCEAICPTWAITRHSKEVSVNRNTCNSCLECVKACRVGCFTYGKG